ncbi:tape measure protein [Lactococcus lactis]|uniref:Tape measure protein n=1 Tax=Lactococcus lactis TaxID=1358 RepID=A0AAW7J689_9LACT|nr:tape measure protein [Lactococcus lactis]MDM7547303.1 tape measure protein [Lactococcus lactis]
MEVFSLFGTLGLRGASDVKAQLQETSKQADNTAKTFDNSTERTGKSSQSLLAKIGAGFTQAGNVAGQFVAGSVRAIGSFGQSLENQGQKMINFGGGAKTALGTVGLSIGTLAMSITAGMKRLDALNGANLVFQSMGAAADTSFGGISKAAKDMTKGTVMSVGDFNSKVQQYIAKGVPQAAAIATTALNAFVKGTSVGMTDAATATARFNSVGMDLNKSTTEFKNMTKVLAGTGNATAAGIDAASLAISQMAGKGKLDMGNMLQLMNTMPNALAFVSQSTGISMKDIQQAISDGKVSYEDFSKALQDQSVKVDEQFAKQGGVMAQTGKTFEGSISNMKAAVARFGASILEGIGQSKITDAMANIGSKIDETATKITPIIPKVVDFGTKLFNLAQKFAPVIGAFLAFKLGALGVGTVMKQVGSVFTTFAKNPILSMLMLLAMWIAQNYAKSEEFRNKVNALLQSMQPLIKIVGDLGNQFKKFFDWLNQGSAGAAVIKTVLVGVVGAIGALTIINTAITWFKAAKSAIETTRIAMMLFNDTLKANWIAIVITAVIALVSALVYFFTQTTAGKQIWQDFINWIKNAWQGISSFFSGLWNGIVQIFNTTVTAIHDFVVPIFNTIASGIQIAMNLIWSVIQIVWQAIKVTVELVVGGIVAYIKWAGEVWLSIITTAMNLISSVIMTVWNAIQPFVMAVVNAIKDVITTVWNTIVSVITTVMTTIGNVISTVWNGIWGFLQPILSAIANFFSSVWNGITSAVSSAVHAVSSVISSVWNGIWGFLQPILSAIGNFISSVWNGIMSTISSVVNSILSVVSNVWNAVSSTTSSVFNTVSSIASSVWNGISSTISSVVNSIQSVVSSVWNSISNVVSSVSSGISGTVSSIWNGLTGIVSGAMNGVMSTVSGILDKIKGFFNFNLSFPKIDIPHIPLPHFSISGDFNPLKGKIPSIGVDWYAKGGILNSPTIFGMNGNNLQVGGEAGREAVLPLNKDTLGGIGRGISETMQSDQQAILDKLDELIEILSLLGFDFDIRLDDGTLVGKLADKMDRAIYDNSRRKQRGRTT